MNYTQATDLIRTHTDYGGSVDVHALALAISSASDVDARERDERKAKDRLYEVKHSPVVGEPFWVEVTFEEYEVSRLNGSPVRILGKIAPCAGLNCGSTDGASHSVECIAEHAAAVAGGRFIARAALSARASEATAGKQCKRCGCQWKECQCGTSPTEVIACGGFDREWEEGERIAASQPNPLSLCGKHCQTGFKDICHAAKFDGVTCADDECDIDSGVRTAPPPAKLSTVSVHNPVDMEESHLTNKGCGSNDDQIAASGQDLTDEQIARAWFGDEYGPGHTRAPGYAYSFLGAVNAYGRSTRDIPEGCTPADAKMLRAANHALSAENDSLREALQFYAEGSHFVMHSSEAWDTVSGEPPNFWEDESSTATVEDGSIAKLTLAQHSVKNSVVT